MVIFVGCSTKLSVATEENSSMFKWKGFVRKKS
jgi:hypothetical protein